MELLNSKRLIYSASHVTTQLTAKDQRELEAKPGRGIQKANLLRALGVLQQDLEPLRARIAAEHPAGQRAGLDKLMTIAERLVASKPPTFEVAALVASVPSDTLMEFARYVLDIKHNSVPLKFAIDLWDRERRILPIGRLHLERIEMYPAGVEKGELVFTVPMAPEETVTISHKEWSTSSREYEDLVQDYFESYSERGVAEKTDASMSTESETSRSSALNFGASLSGGVAGVTLTTTLGLSNTSAERQSVKQSMQKAREVTEKASARSRQEHKVSVKLEAKHGVEDSAYRTITNPGQTAARVDYYRMMRKWRTDLFRYGLRLTYDIMIPTPGVRLWALQTQLKALDERLLRPLPFTLQPGSLEGGNYHAEALKVGATMVDDLPRSNFHTTFGGPDIQWGPESVNFKQGHIEFDVPEGYVLKSAVMTADVVFAAGTAETVFDFRILGAEANAEISWAWGQPYKQHLVSHLPNHVGATGHVIVGYHYRSVESAGISIDAEFQETPAHYEAWQRSVWRQIRAAAEARYQEETSRVQVERDRLWRLLNGKDTLSLRRLEREELLRLIVEWLVGPAHTVIGTPTVEQTLTDLLASEHQFQLATTPSSINRLPITEDAWSDALLFGEFVKFIQQAVEWENLVYFFYPYFWGSDAVGRDKMLFEHPDPEHERFLRAGYARIVLTVRPGFEQAFTNFVETGALDPDFVSSYVPIATEIANFARTNYAGIPPANPEREARPLLFPEQRATWEAMQELMKAIDEHRAKHGVYPDALADLEAPPPTLDAWGHELVYRKPGLGADYDLISLGEDGEVGGEGLKADISSAAGASLVSTWFDYTPTSALDIEIDTKPADIA
jgi:hypothetical protein